MELVQLSCNGCGADIEVTEDARFVTCRYCQAKLEVKRTDGAAFTSVRKAVARVERKTDALADEMKELKAENRALSIENEIDDLDREWEEREKELMTRTKRGELTVPTRGAAIAVGVLSAIIGMLGLFVAASPKGERGALFGVVIALGGGILAYFQHQKAVAYERAHADYSERRDELLDELEKAKRRKGRRSKD